MLRITHQNAADPPVDGLSFVKVEPFSLANDH